MIQNGKIFKDSFSGKGTVTKRLINKTTGEIAYEHTDHNLIVKLGRSFLIRALAGENLDVKITDMSIGKGGTSDLGVNAFNPIDPVDGDTDLLSKIKAVNIAAATTNLAGTNPKVTFTALFDCDEIDSLVNECGLHFGDATIFARHTFDTVSLKSSSNFSLQISWAIEF